MQSVIASLMPEKRPGQEIIRFYTSAERKELFRQYCSFRETSMTEALEECIDSLISDESFKAYLEMKRHLQEK